MFKFSVRSREQNAIQWLSTKLRADRLKRPVSTALTIFTKRLLLKLKEHTPVDDTPTRDNIVAAEHWKRVGTVWQVGTQWKTVIRNTVPYAVVLEYGSLRGQPPWPNVGPRTTFGYSQWDYEQTGASGVFIMSSQAPYGMVSAALNDIGGVAYLGKLVKQEIERASA